MNRSHGGPPTFGGNANPLDRLQRTARGYGRSRSMPVGAPDLLDFGSQAQRATGSWIKSHKARADECWVPAGSSAEVGGHDLGGMVYVGQGLETVRGGEVENCLIDPSLPVATRIVREATLADYAPRYTQLSPSDRLGYLRWLASSRSDANVAPPFLRLYFFGLERRLVLDNPPAPERAGLIAEVQRLEGIYGEEYGLDEEFVDLLEFVSAMRPESIEPEPERMADHRSSGLPLSLAVGLGYRLAAGSPITGRWLVSWWLAQPAIQVKAGQRRILDEFLDLFALRYDRRYPRGMKIAKPARRYNFTYFAASGSFERKLCEGADAYPDVSRLRKPLRVAKRMADECWSALVPYRRFLARKPSAAGSTEAHLYLPPDLAVSRPHPGLQALHEWAEEQVDDRSAEVCIEDVLTVFEGEPTEVLRKQRVVAAANALALGSLGLAPDPRFVKRLPRFGDPAALFRLPSKAPKPTDVSAQYAPTLLILKLVMFVAKADGSVSEAKWRVMEAMISRRQRLRPADRLRLVADLRWLRRQWIGAVSLRRPCDALKPRELDEACETAVKVACADGPVDPEAVKAVQKLYRAMGRSPDSAFASLHRRSANEPTESVAPRKAAKPSPGFTLRQGPRHGLRRVGQSVDLDHGRISEIVEDTRKVSNVLSDVFVEEDAATAGVAATPAGASASPPVFEGLDASHSALVEGLLKRPNWSESEFDRLVKRCGLMPGGALEAVNEWSFERFGDALVEEDDVLTLNPEVLEEMRASSSLVPDATA